MPRIAVVTDSTADFPGDAQERLAIEMVPLTVIWDGQSLRDKIDLRIEDFYKLMRQRSTLPTTSAPSAGLFEETYERLLGDADHVISVHLAGRLSATLDVARGAAERIGGGRVSVVDSKQTSMCLGWLAMRAAELGTEGAEPAAVVRELESWVPRLRLYAVLDTLTNVQRSGRIGRAQALVGSLLNFKPLILIKESEVLPVERPRSRASAMRRIVDVVASQGRIQKVGVAEGDAPEIMNDLVRLVGERIPGVPVDRGEIGIVLGTHAGPGVFGVATLLASSPTGMAIPGARTQPPELENARKILELERRQGYQDRAVTTGLASFLERWERRLKTPEVQRVGREVLAALDGYATLAPAARAEQIERALRR